MRVRLKKLHDQVIVITGASSGIGLATAQLAARQGAKVVLACRNQQALDDVVAGIRADGGDALAVPADVGVAADHDRILGAAIERYGRVDTWVNNAGVSIFGRLEDVPVEDQRKLFDTNYWGVVYGSTTAVAHLKKQGGALINMGSEVSDRAIPLQGAYSASKHAVKGYTDALRMELEADGAPVSVTLIKPASIATGYAEHARNYMDVEPRLPPPLYAADTVAQAILYAAQHPQRDIFVGSASKAMSSVGLRMPGLADRMAGWLIRNQRSDAPAGERADALYEAGTPAGGDTARDGARVPHVRKTSMYTHLSTGGRGLLWAGATVLICGTVLGAARGRRWH
ncbi:SDR family oxidoreductase [Bordetella sp. BOR01]|uniref:SDR family oxidoreductase n=1 Tax=Bordetella sp. BOR01 TaxID=2854779 RepID=UPI001C448345|nr:SDR family oxidoreductase [Bordetella sp. BOR01]MBV7486138.1 SDR family oxidoreductase [Bordetella sp. BOR01]